MARRRSMLTIDPRVGYDPDTRLDMLLERAAFGNTQGERVRASMRANKRKWSWQK